MYAIMANCTLTPIEVVYDIFDKCTQLWYEYSLHDQRYCDGPLTSVVHEPELEGWKKLSVDAIILARESNALEPPK